MYIKREIEKVFERQSRRKPVIIITGFRQVGKSTMLKNVLGKQVKYVTLDNVLAREKAIENPIAFLDFYKPPVIIDQFQKATVLLEYIKEIVDANDQPGQYYLTGSQSFKLMKGVSESLVGRAGIITMTGLSFHEIVGDPGRPPFKPSVDLSLPPLETPDIITLVHKGSFPELYKQDSDLNDWSDFYQSYLHTYIEKDIREITNIHDTIAFTKFIKAMAALSGEQLNYVTIANLCDKDVNTVKRWTSILEASGIIYLLPPYYNNFNKRLIKTPKIYFLDTGLVCYLGGWNTPQQLVSGARWGHIFETYVVSQIVKSYYNNGKGMLPLYYFRDKDKREVDLLIEEADTIYPIEIKSGSNPTTAMIRSFEQLEKIPGKKIGLGAVICLAHQLLPLSDKVLIIPVQYV